MRKSCSAAQKKKFAMEIGFGDGQHLYGQAKNNPQNGYVGVEVFQNGVANLLTLISGIKDGDKLPEEIRAEDYPVRNIRVYDDDVRLLFKQIPDNFLIRFFCCFRIRGRRKSTRGGGLSIRIT